MKGKIPEDRRPESGWALCHWGEIGHGPLVRAGRDAGRFDDDLIAALAGLVRAKVTLAPTWLTWVPSDRRPDLVPDVARRLARTGSIRRRRSTLSSGRSDLAARHG